MVPKTKALILSSEVFFQKQINFGYFDPTNIFFDDKKKYFSGWPTRYFGYNGNTDTELQASGKRARDIESEPGPRRRLKTRAVAGRLLLSELPSVVVDGVTRLAKLNRADVHNPSAIKCATTPSVFHVCMYVCMTSDFVFKSKQNVCGVLLPETYVFL